MEDWQITAAILFTFLILQSILRADGDSRPANTSHHDARLNRLEQKLDHIMREMGISQPTLTATPLAPPLPNIEAIKESLHRGNKIEAIKLYREMTNMGLKEAKDAGELLATEMKMNGEL